MNIEDLSRPFAARRALLRSNPKHASIQVRQRDEPFRRAQGAVKAALGTPGSYYFSGPVGPTRRTF